MGVVGVTYKDYRGTPITMTTAAFLAKAANEPFFPWPYPIARAILEDEPRPPGISVTSLLTPCLRCAVLQKHYDYTVNIEDQFFAMRGTAFHSTIEAHAQRGSIAECRFYMNLPDGSVLHGKPDLILPEHGCIIDLKTTKSAPRWKVWENHEAQLNIYRWLVNHAYKWDRDLAGFDPNTWKCSRLGVWYVDDTGPKPMEVRTKVEVATKPGAKSAFKTEKVPHVWSDEEVEAFVIPRYMDQQEAYEAYERDKTLPPYPPGFDPFRFWYHRGYSPVSYQCVTSWYAEGGHIEHVKTLDEQLQAMLDSYKESEKGEVA